VEAVSVRKPPIVFTGRDAAAVWARAFNSRNSSVLTKWLAHDLRYVSEWADDEIDNPNDYLEHLEARLKTIRDSAIEARAELAEMAPFPGSLAEPQPCVMVDLDRKPLATVLFQVDGSKITRIEFCLNPAPDACVRTGIFPGLDVFKNALQGTFWH
jgi:hypothetical protein